jgi:membrane protein implicated in regulation of membrane protease activity
VSVVFWAWVCVAVLLALSEAVTGGMLVIPWAAGAAVAALLEALHVSSGWQWLAFVGVSMALFVVAQRIIRRHK